MSNRLALILGIIVVAAIALDHFFGWGAGVFLGRKFLTLIQVIAFWQ